MTAILTPPQPRNGTGIEAPASARPAPMFVNTAHAEVDKPDASPIISNYLCLLKIVDRGGQGYYTPRALKIAVEHFQSGDGGFLATWVSNNAFVGYGEDLDAALNDLRGLFEADFQFYNNLAEDQLTEQTRARQGLLRQLFIRKEV